MSEVTTPTRERVEAYEKALGCVPMKVHAFCAPHSYFGPRTPLGCPVAVAAARVEAERIALTLRIVRAQCQSVEQVRAPSEGACHAHGIVDCGSWTWES